MRHLLIVASFAISLDTAQAQGVVVTIEPPYAYIATSTPEYYEGRPVYYYNGYWYYRDRDHRRWMYYRHEPGYLRERRAHWAPPPRREWREEHREHEREERREDRREDREYRGGDWNGRYHYRR